MTSELPSYGVFCTAVRELSETPSEAVDTASLNSFLKQVPLTALLAVIGANQELDDEAVRQQSIKCLSRLVERVEGRDALLHLAELRASVLVGLSHAEPLVQCATATLLTDLLRYSGIEKQQQTLLQLIGESSIFSALLHLLEADLTEVAEQAANVFVEMARSGDAGLDLIFSESGVARVKQMVEGASTVSVRVLSLYAKLSTISAHTFTCCQQSGLLQRAIVLFKEADDILLQLSICQVIAEISESVEGIRYLSVQNIGNVIASFLPSRSDRFLTCSALKLLESLVNSSLNFSETSWLKNTNIPSFLTECLESEQGDIIEVAITALCSACRTEIGLRALFEISSNLSSFLQDPHPRTVRTAALHGLALIFEATEWDGKTQPSVSQLHMQIFYGAETAEEGTPMTLLGPLKTLIVDVEIDVRIGAYALLRALAITSFGCVSMVRCSSLLNLVLDRELEVESRAKPFQFSVVQALSRNPALNEAEFDSIRERLLEHTRQGPYYRGRETQLMTE